MKFKAWTPVVVMMLFAALTAGPVSAQQRNFHRTDLSTWPGSDRVSLKSDATANGKIENQNHDVRYSVVTIGVLPGKTNTVLPSPGRAVNNLGDIAGFSFVYTGDFHSIYLTVQGFTWHKGRLTPLPLLNGYPGAFAIAINEVGQVAGEANLIDSNGQIRQTAVRWDHGQPTNLGTLKPNSNSATFDLNNWGAVVGESYSFDDQQLLPVAWYQGAAHALPLLPGEAGGEAFQINDLGLIVGHQFSNSNDIPCLWYWNGSSYTATDLGSFGGDFGQGLGINLFGQVVGWSLNAGNIHGPAFVWDAVHGLQALPSLPGDTDGSGNFINELGQITGYSQLFDNNGNLLSQREVIWQNGTPTDLQTLVPPGTPTFNTVGEINNFGQIAMDSGSFGDGSIAGYLLVPTH
jgi:uncharacterized membrane protein